jgi:hypothetical protein
MKTTLLTALALLLVTPAWAGDVAIPVKFRGDWCETAAPKMDGKSNVRSSYVRGPCKPSPWGMKLQADRFRAHEEDCKLVGADIKRSVFKFMCEQPVADTPDEPMEIHLRLDGRRLFMKAKGVKS